MAFSCIISAQSISLDWVRQIGGTSYDIGDHVLTDQQGNVYTLGRFYNTIDFDPGPATYNLTSNGDYDVFIQKLDANGNFVWAKSIGSGSLDYVYGAALDQANNLIFCGLYGGTMDIDPGPAIDNRTISGIFGDMYVVKLNSAGNFMWGHTMGDTMADRFSCVAIDANNNIVLAGLGFGTIDYDPGPGTNVVSGGAGVFVQYAPNGSLNWVRAIYGTAPNNEPYTTAIDIDNNGDIIAIGNWKDTLDFDPGPGVFNMGTAPLDAELYILKLNNSGNFLWAKRLNSDNYIATNTIKTDNTNNIYIAGDFANNMDMDPDPTVTYNLSGPGSAAFIVKLSSVGTFIWARKMGGTSGGWAHDEITSIAIEPQGDVILVGYVSGTEDFDPGPNVQLINSTKSHDETDAFVMKLSNAGNLLFVKDFGDTATERINDVSLDQQGNIFVTGYFGNNNINQTPWHPTDFDPNAGVVNMLSNGQIDGFLSKFKACTPTAGIDIVNACGPYTWIDGNTYNSSTNNALDTLANSNGCDSVVTLNLTITTIDTNIIKTADSLISNELSATSFQWINCEDNSIMAGATNQYYIPAVSGNYAVIINKNGCIDTSACMSFMSVGYSLHSSSKTIILYPNPITAGTPLILSSPMEGKFVLTNQLGQLFFEKKIDVGENTFLLPKMATGVYHYRFITNRGYAENGLLMINN